MNKVSIGLLALCLAGTALAAESPAWLQPRSGPGSPGTATPQAPAQPPALTPPRTPSGNPPLLRNGGGPPAATPERPAAQPATGIPADNRSPSPPTPSSD